MAEGQVQMIDVGDKAVTRRRAVARAVVVLAPSAADRLRDGTLPKGDALTVCRVAAIMAAKRTPDLLPLCHPLPLSHVGVEATQDGTRDRPMELALSSCSTRMRFPNAGL